MKKIITRSSLLMFPNWFTPWSWPPLYICMYEFQSAFIFINDYSVSKLLFTMIFSIVRILFLIFFWWWWWWISFVNSHFVRSKTYCCCWHCIEVMEFNTHTHSLRMNSNCQFVLLCNNDSITTHMHAHTQNTEVLSCSQLQIWWLDVMLLVRCS
jgi:hypothetical protein